MVCGVGDERCWCRSRLNGGSGAEDGGCGGDDFVVVVVVMLRRHGEKGGLGSVDRFAPELEMPVDEGAIVIVHLCVFNDDCPGPNAGFAPDDR